MNTRFTVCPFPNPPPGFPNRFGTLEGDFGIFVFYSKKDGMTLLENLNLPLEEKRNLSLEIQSSPLPESMPELDGVIGGSPPGRFVN